MVIISTIIKKFNEKFEWKILVYIIPLILLMSILFAVIFIVRESGLLRDQLIERGIATAQNLAFACEPAIYPETNLELLNKLTEGTFVRDDVEFSIIYKADGKILSSRVRSKMSNDEVRLPPTIKEEIKKKGEMHQPFSLEKGGKGIEFYAPIKIIKVKESIKNDTLSSTKIDSTSLNSSSKPKETEIITIGFTRVGISNRGIVARNNTIILISFVISVVFVIFGVGATYLFAKRITGPVRKLITVAEAIKEGNLDQQIDEVIVEGEDEIGKLAKTFNLMTRELKRNNEQLDKAKQELEVQSNEVKAMAKILTTITGTLDLDEILFKIVGTIKKIGYEKVVIYLLEKDKNLLQGKLVGEDKDIPANLLKVPLTGDKIGLIGKCALEKNVYLIKDATTDARVKDAIVYELGMKSLITLPMVVGEKVAGVMVLGNTHSERDITFEHAQSLLPLANGTGIAIENAYLHKEVSEKERMQKELEIAREIQASLLPRSLPTTEGIDVVPISIPALEVGGDYYDFLQLNGRLGIVIGDVSGKGLHAGLVMTMARSILHSTAPNIKSPKDTLVNLNNILGKDMESTRFMTMLYMNWDYKERIMKYSGAGHEHILHYKPRLKECERIKTGGVAIGMVDDLQDILEDKIIECEPNDTIILYTDGVTEAENENHDMFGLDRVQEILVKYGDRSPEEIHRLLLNRIQQFIGNAKQWDDITFMVIKIK